MLCYYTTFYIMYCIILYYSKLYHIILYIYYTNFHLRSEAFRAAVQWGDALQVEALLRRAIDPNLPGALERRFLKGPVDGEKMGKNGETWGKNGGTWGNMGKKWGKMGKIGKNLEKLVIS